MNGHDCHLVGESMRRSFVFQKVRRCEGGAFMKKVVCFACAVDLGIET